MALKEKISQDELMLYEVLKNPVLCGEFINNLDRIPQEERFEFTWYQKEMLCDFNSYVSFCCGRATGKTVSLVNLIVWIMINNIFPDNYINYHVPGKSHVEPVFTGLTRAFRTNTLLKHFLLGKSGVNGSDLKITLVNGASLLCRIAGQSGTGAPVVGLHAPFVIVDEGGYYPMGTWNELLPTLNTFTSGFRLIVSGVPTGIRENNVLYHADMENTSYTKHRVSALQNPRFSKEDEERSAVMYGGRDTDEYVHLILGEHGKPIYALFDRNSMDISDYPVYKLIINGLKMSGDISQYFTTLSVFPGLPTKHTQCIMGIDLGYTEPTAIIILYLDAMGRLKFHGRIKLDKVDYFLQEKIIDWLDTKFSPLVISIDEGNAGKAVVQRLLEHDDYLHKNYKKRLVPVNFSSSIVLGTDSNDAEIKAKTKPFAVGLLQEYTMDKKLIYSSTDMDMIIELERMTYTKNPSGDIAYRTLTERGGKRGEDHFTSALLCGTLGYYLQTDSLNFRAKRAKLASPTWFLGGK